MRATRPTTVADADTDGVAGYGSHRRHDGRAIQQFTKFRNQSVVSGNTNSSYAAGTYAASDASNATSTNVVATLNALAHVLGKIPW